MMSTIKWACNEKSHHYMFQSEVGNINTHSLSLRAKSITAPSAHPHMNTDVLESAGLELCVWVRQSVSFLLSWFYKDVASHSSLLSLNS